MDGTGQLYASSTLESTSSALAMPLLVLALTGLADPDGSLTALFLAAHSGAVRHVVAPPICRLRWLAIRPTTRRPWSVAPAGWVAVRDGPEFAICHRCGHLPDLLPDDHRDSYPAAGFATAVPTPEGAAVASLAQGPAVDPRGAIPAGLNAAVALGCDVLGQRMQSWLPAARQVASLPVLIQS